MHTRMGQSKRCKPNTTHKLSLHRQASISRELITMEPKRCAGCVEPSKLQSWERANREQNLYLTAKLGGWMGNGSNLVLYY